jgi:hypothetical protein
LRRKVTGQELARNLRGLGITEVVIERACPDRFIRTFYDYAGRPVAAGIDFLNERVVPNAPNHTISQIPSGEVIVDRADVTSPDREYFEQNPDSAEYERDALPVELNQALSPPGFKPRNGRVRVQQLTPGFRIRELLWIAE